MSTWDDLVECDAATTLYVEGMCRRTGEGVLVVATLTPTAWRARSTSRGISNDYSSSLGIEELKEWMRNDLHKPRVIDDRESAKEILPCRAGFLETALYANSEGVDRVLRHLEQGW